MSFATYFKPCIQVGQASLERSYYLNKTELEDAARDLLLLHSQLPVMEALVHCIRKNWMAILVSLFLCYGISVLC